MSIKIAVMDKRLERKLNSLRERIRKMDGALVAFSGGVDSAFLMRICRDELGEKAVAITTLSENYPRSELAVARRVAKIIGVKHLILDTSRKPDNARMPSRGAGRGSKLYSSMKSVAIRMKIKHIFDGSHKDDAQEKGRRFLEARRAGIRSPLLESNLSKAEIRLLAKELKLPNWDKPASSKKKGAPKKRASAPNAEKAREYLSGLSAAVRMRLRGDKAYLIVNRHGMVELARRIGMIKRRMKAFGFSDVLLKLSS
jgi:uncharacterized protein